MEYTIIRNPIAVKANLIGSLKAGKFDIMDAAIEALRVKSDGECRYSGAEKDTIRGLIAAMREKLDEIDRSVK